MMWLIALIRSFMRSAPSIRGRQYKEGVVLFRLSHSGVLAQGLPQLSSFAAPTSQPKGLNRTPWSVGRTLRELVRAEIAEPQFRTCGNCQSLSFCGYACECDLPSIFPPSPTNSLPFLFLRKAQQFEISVVVERTSTRSSKDEKERCPNYRYQIERQEKDKFGDLAEGKGRVDRGGCRFAEHLYGIRSVVEEDARGRYEVDEALADECSLEGGLAQVRNVLRRLATPGSRAKNIHRIH